mgnify:CR=1 FL=1
MLPSIGKIDRTVFDKIIFPKLGIHDKKVIVGPQHGVDAAVILLDEVKRDIMVIAEDPTFGLPSLLDNFGWAIVHICASDVAVLGVPPKYMTICLLLPPGTDASLLDSIWTQIHNECTKLGISIVGGHTGIYPGISYPLNGGCTVIGLGREDQITPPSNAKVGDKIILTKGPAIEATGVLAVQAEHNIKEALGKPLLEKAKKHFFNMTVVEDALTCAEYAHAMHDATEGGVLNAVYEVAEASKTGCLIYEDNIVIPEEISALCGYFHIDPLISISEGTLIVTCPPENVEPIQDSLKKKQIKSWEIGEITNGHKYFIRKDGRKQVLTPVKVDPFWEAYFKSMKT